MLTNFRQYPVITANEVPRDQRLSASQSYQGSSQAGGDVKKARSHRKGRASGSGGRRHANSGSGSANANANANANSSRRSSRSSEVPRPLQRNASSSSSQKSQPSQRVDLVVEDHEAEEEDRVQTQRELGSAWAGGETRHFS